MRSFGDNGAFTSDAFVTFRISAFDIHILEIPSLYRASSL